MPHETMNPSPTLASLRDAAEGLRQVREDLRAALRCADPVATLAIEGELEQVAKQTLRIKRLADAVASEESNRTDGASTVDA